MGIMAAGKCGAGAGEGENISDNVATTMLYSLPSLATFLWVCSDLHQPKSCFKSELIRPQLEAYLSVKTEMFPSSEEVVGLLINLSSP